MLNSVRSCCQGFALTIKLRKPLLCIITSFSMQSGYSTANDDLDALLNLELAELMEVKVVTASKTPEKLSESVANLTLLTEAMIRRSGARTLADVLSFAAGISVGRREVGENTVSSRGVFSFDSPGMLLMLNGHVLNGARTGSAFNQFLSDLPVKNIKQIEIVKGPGSVLYGANAFLGVINVITNSGSDIEGTDISLTSEFEGGDDIGWRHNVNYGRDFGGGSQLALNLSALDYSGVSLSVEADSAGIPGEANTEYRQTDLQLKYETTLLFINARLHDRSSGGEFGLGGVISDNNQLRSSGEFLELGWKLQLKDDLLISPLVYFDRIEMDNHLFVDSEETIQGKIAVTESLTGGEIKGTYQGFSEHVLISGYVYREERLHNVETVTNVATPGGPVLDVTGIFDWIDSGSRTIRSVYLTDIWSIDPSLQLNAGIRYDNYSDFGGTTNPRVALAWQFAEKLKLITSYGTAFRAPDFGSQYVKNNPSVVGNPNLDPETIDTLEISLVDRIGPNNWGKLTFYHSKVKDLIGIPDDQIQFQNFENVTVNGIELERIYYFNGRAQLSGYYTYTRSELDAGYDFPHIPTSTARLELVLPLGESLSWFFDVNWQDEAQRSSNDDREDMDGYTTANTSLSYDLPWQGMALKLSIFNLFDEEYAHPSPAHSIPGDYTASGRSAVIEFRYHLSNK